MSREGGGETYIVNKRKEGGKRRPYMERAGKIMGHPENRH